MLNSRRRFLKSSVVIGASLAGSVSATGFGQSSPSQEQTPKGILEPPLLLPPSIPASQLQIPKVKFGDVEISRLIIGCNPFYGFSHLNDTLSTIMKEWYTPDKVCDVLHQCNRFGINTFNYLHAGRGPADLQRFREEGGQLHVIAQGFDNPEAIVKDVHPLAIYHNGEFSDRALRAGKMDTIREYCKKLRQLGVMVGVGAHNPEVIARVEEAGWDVDFYAGCVYQRTRTPEEFRKLLNGELPVGEVYLEDDPPRMYKVLRQTKKPCFAFKVLAAGRINRPDDLNKAFRLAFESIKPTDCIFVGMFPRTKNEVRENVEYVHKILKGNS
ncbi:MAG: hypothetical protein H6Q04_270 [Acidobacteria bacterium]|jgi:thiamine monophosphate synthase|nr:hypothetical protein [Acidobacteriota bacterium]